MNAGRSHRPSSWRRFLDGTAGRLFAAAAAFPALVLAAVFVGLLLRSRPIFEECSLWSLLAGSDWHPADGRFGFLPFLAGTAWVTTLAMVIAVPPSILTAIYVAEYARPATRAFVKPLLDVLAGIPSVVYGVWGVVAIVPLVRDTLGPALGGALGFIPLFRNDNPTGYSVLAGGIVLAVMVAPVIVSVTCEVLRAVPSGLREAALAMGSTHWQAVKHVVLKRAAPGVIAGIVLGFSRAFGETMAVLMVVGNVPRIPGSVFDPAYPLTALIANNYGEMMSIPRYDAALLLAALLLMLVVVAFNVTSTLFLRRVTRGLSA